MEKFKSEEKNMCLLVVLLGLLRKCSDQGNEIIIIYLIWVMIQILEFDYDLMPAYHRPLPLIAVIIVCG